MIDARKTVIALAAIALYVGLTSSGAGEPTLGEQPTAPAEVWPGSAAPRWGFPPVDVANGRIARTPSAEQQFATFHNGSWPGAQESRWSHAHGSEQASEKGPSAAQQWMAAGNGNWPGKAESRWGQAHVPGDDVSSVDRRAALAKQPLKP